MMFRAVGYLIPVSYAAPYVLMPCCTRFISLRRIFGVILAYEPRYWLSLLPLENCKVGFLFAIALT